MKATKAGDVACMAFICWGLLQLALLASPWATSLVQAQVQTQAEASSEIRGRGGAGAGATPDLRIQAGHVALNYHTQQVVFSQRVKAVYGDVVLEAPRLIWLPAVATSISQQQPEHKPGSEDRGYIPGHHIRQGPSGQIKFDGPAVIRDLRHNCRIASDAGFFDPASKSLSLVGHVSVISDDVVAKDVAVMEYDMARDFILLKGDKRSKVRLQINLG